MGDVAHSIGLPLHVDGARLMNAVVASGISAKRILQACDTASICFSKGLGTPVGSVIVGSGEFIQKYVSFISYARDWKEKSSNFVYM